MAGATSYTPPDVAPVKARSPAPTSSSCHQMDTAYAAACSTRSAQGDQQAAVDRSVRRIPLHKLERGLFDDRFVDAAAGPQVMRVPPHLATAQAITDRTTISC